MVQDCLDGGIYTQYDTTPTAAVVISSVLKRRSHQDTLACQPRDSSLLYSYPYSVRDRCGLVYGASPVEASLFGKRKNLRANTELEKFGLFR